MGRIDRVAVSRTGDRLSLGLASWTLYLLAVGSYGRALTFLVAQVVIVGGIDNFLRPALIEGRVRMHTLVVFFSIVGGISYFGILGMFIGPLVFAMGIAFLEFYIESTPASGDGS